MKHMADNTMDLEWHPSIQGKFLERDSTLTELQKTEKILLDAWTGSRRTMLKESSSRNCEISSKRNMFLSSNSAGILLSYRKRIYCYRGKSCSRVVRTFFREKRCGNNVENTTCFSHSPWIRRRFHPPVAPSLSVSRVSIHFDVTSFLFLHSILQDGSPSIDRSIDRSCFEKDWRGIARGIRDSFRCAFQYFFSLFFSFKTHIRNRRDVSYIFFFD